MARASRTRDADDTRCHGCGAPIIRYRWLGLPITATKRALTPTEQQTIRDNPDPDRLIWCARTGPFTPTRLQEVYRSTHPPDCPHPHVTDHRCPQQTYLI